VKKVISDVAKAINNILPGSMKEAGGEKDLEKKRFIAGFGEVVTRCHNSKDYKDGIGKIIYRLKGEFEREHLQEELPKEKEQFTRGKLKAIIILEDRINQSIVAGVKAAQHLNNSNQEK